MGARAVATVGGEGGGGEVGVTEVAKVAAAMEEVRAAEVPRVAGASSPRGRWRQGRRR